MDRAAIIADLTRAFALREGIIAAYLFGSVARDEARDSSDVDVGVLLAAGAPRDLEAFGELGDLQADLEEVLGREVDVVALNDAHPDLVYRVLRDGVLLHESDEGARVQFELNARNEYFDMQPIWELYRRTVLESV